ncbi:BgTH12-00156 [Blumeria graminis f. sp. triticale]|uniref:ATPase synthesis protein 25 n=3 Tax=Blumeria graminis TaxID=34373 RepID=A0A381L275_BLUGR|nr:hypothetical protein BGT96224_3664 [Blumeria graminis f. sp. tritici 96224]CAD6504650.1 BgTH12-00156 [Blumeria graminis f. sp. triticale]VDB92681.1 Bgt-3664 [Blumeria graminis f. sp. tritici]
MNCAGCRLAVLKKFTSLPKIATHSANFSKSIGSGRALQFGQWRRISQFSPEQRDSTNIASVDEQKNATQSEEGRDLSLEAQTNTTPWYLRVESPQHTPILSERQRIPDPPKSPPEILQPLMNKISIDLGLDNLSLLDLRGIDPPPALGANLLMIIGTARSEKHLHVSADRLCRWLRSEYKLHPDADGLLGRNELKIKLKRKAKRAKLMKSKDQMNDDGIRSGWVCIDIGTTAGHEIIEENAPPRSFIGFGPHTNSVRIVVQMLSEEKREEIKLEELWGKVLQRSTWSESSGSAEEIDLAEDDDHQATREQPMTAISNKSQQIRELHTRSRAYSTTRQHFKPIASYASKQINELDTSHFCMINSDQLSPTISTNSIIRRENILAHLALGNYEQAMAEASRYSETETQYQKGNWRTLYLGMLVSHLRSLPRDEAFRCLGTGPSDRESNSFLTSYYQTFSDKLLIEEHLPLHIEFLCFGQSLHHPEYNTQALAALHRNMTLDSVKIQKHTYLRLLQGILDFNPQNENANAAKFAAKSAANVLDTMYSQGQDLIDEDFLVYLQILISRSALSCDDSDALEKDFKYKRDNYGLISVPMPVVQDRLHLVMIHLNLPMFRDGNRIQLLQLYAKGGHWLEFWEIFHMAYLHDRPQGSEIFACMFALIASNNNQTTCARVLRDWFPSLLQECPSISTRSKLAESVRACLHVIDPELQAQGPQLSKVKNSEWFQMWKYCTQPETSNL